MELQGQDGLSPGFQEHTNEIRILTSADGGWDVTAMLDGRVVASRHCEDWHRAERTCRRLETELLAHLRTGALKAVILGLLLGMVFGGAVAAQAQDTSVPDQAPSVSSAPAPDVEGVLPEPGAIGRAIEFANRIAGSSDGGEVKNGFYPEFSNMVTGAGWISAGPGYRHWLFGDQLIVDASAGLSWRSYTMAQARFELPKLARSRLAIGSQVRWQDLTQVTYFGQGPETLDTDRSEYRLKSTNVVGYATVRPVQWLAVTGRVGWLARPTLGAPAGTFERGNPATQDLFPEDPAFTVSQQPSYAYREVLVTADTRDRRSRPTRGGVYRVAWTGYSDQDNGPFEFRRSEAEGAQFIPLAGSRVVLAMHGWLVASDTGAGDTIPFYLMPSLGGNNTLRAYTDFRFHDRNLLLVNAEARLALFTHVDAALFVDAGNVAPRVGDLNLDKRALGVGLRMHTRRATFARFDIAHGDEGWRFLFRMNDPLRLARLTRRTAAAPFAP